MSDSEQVCGYTEDDENLPEGIAPITCDERTWGDRDRCLWHSRSDDKPIDVIDRQWPNAPSRIDGLFLKGVQLGNRIDFSGKILYAGQFCGADLTESNFQGADLDYADFEEAILRSARFDSDGTNLSKANFKQVEAPDARFQKAKLHNTKFLYSNLRSAKFQKADAADAMFVHSELHEAKLIAGNFRSAKFDHAELHKSDCGNANFESASLKGADLRGASFVDSDWWDVDIRDAKVNHDTDFGNQLCREFVADREAEWKWFTLVSPSSYAACLERSLSSESVTADSESYQSKREMRYEEVSRIQKSLAAASRLVKRNPIHSSGQDALSDLREAEHIYRDIKQLYRENTIPELQRRFNIREKEIKRKISYSEGSISWFRWTTLRWTMGYGESVKQVIVASLGVILLSSILYPIWGLQLDQAETLRYSLSGSVSIKNVLAVLFFSLRRLVSATNGMITPVGPSEWIALMETALGTLLTAMLVFVFGRRATS